MTLTAVTKAARQAVTWREKRDELIVQAVQSGAGVREVARAAGLTHPAVLNIVKRNQP